MTLFDAIVVGGGLVKSAIAYGLAWEGLRSRRVKAALNSPTRLRTA